MKTTDVFIVLDQSGSMAGAKTETARRMVYEMADTLARAEVSTSGSVDPHRFNVTVIPFGTHVGSQPARRPLEIVTGWPGSVPTMLNLGEMTALRDAVGRALELAEGSRAQAQLITVFTDGQENRSYSWSAPRLRETVARLEKTGKLTLTLAGPAEAKAELEQCGLPAGNFRPWDGSEKQLKETATATTKALETYVTQRAVGVTTSRAFYTADLSQVTPAGIRANTKLVTPAETRVVTKRMAGRAIADFYGSKFVQGQHYYQLVKPEYLQDDKDLVVFIKDKGEYRQGSRAIRALMGLPETGKIRIKPAEHADKYDLFVQSSSVNRKVVEGQVLLTLP